jgi:hypothetical protein
MARRRYDEDDYDEDDYDRPVRRREQVGGLDKMFLDTNMVVLVLFAICCGGIALILSIIELAIGKDPEAKRRATTVLIISIVVAVIVTVGQVVGLMLGGRR